MSLIIALRNHSERQNVNISSFGDLYTYTCVDERTPFRIRVSYTVWVLGVITQVIKLNS